MFKYIKERRGGFRIMKDYKKKWDDLKEWLNLAIKDCHENNCHKCSYGKQILETMSKMEQGEYER
jgi:hypothetical protein